MVKQAPHLTRQFDFYKHIYKKIIQAATNRWVIPLPDMTVQLVYLLHQLERIPM